MPNSLGQQNVATSFKKLPKMEINRPRWSHRSGRVFFYKSLTVGETFSHGKENKSLSHAKKLPGTATSVNRRILISF